MAPWLSVRGLKVPWLLVRSTGASWSLVRGLGVPWLLVRGPEALFLSFILLLITRGGVFENTLASRIHFEVLGLEASSPRKLACRRLEDSTIF